MENENHDLTQDTTGASPLRPSPALAVRAHADLQPRRVATRSTSRRSPAAGPETYGNRYVFGFIDRTTLSTQLRLSYTFSPDLNLDVYMEPFAASGRYDRLRRAAAPAHSRSLLVYGQNGTASRGSPTDRGVVTDGASTFALPNSDFNVRSFRSNVVLKWEWRPGSLLYVVWQQNRASSVRGGEPRRRRAASSIRSRRRATTSLP